MRRKPITLLATAWLILGVIPTHLSYARTALPRARLKAVTVSGSPSGSQLLLRVEGEYAFRTVEATEGTIFVDLKGVQASGVPKSGQWTGGLLTGYRLMPYTDARGQPVVRVQIEMKHREPFAAEQDRLGLRLVFGQASAGHSPSADAQPSEVATSGQKTLVRVARARLLPVASRGTASVTGVSIKSAPDGETFVDVSTTQPTSYRAFRLENPARLVVDLEEAHNATHQRVYSVQSSLLKAVRVGQFRAKNPSVVRLVADLSEEPSFDVHAQPGGVRIELKSRHVATAAASRVEARAGASPVQPAAATPSAAAPPKPVELAQSIAVPPPTPAVKEDSGVRPETNSAAQSDYQSALPAASGAKEVAAAPRAGPPGLSAESLKASRAARILGGSEVIAGALQGQAPAGAPAAQEQPTYTGEPISLNLKDVDLKDFFRLIHEISGLNIIVDPNVAGTVTLVLDAVPWDQALDIVLKNNRLGRILEGNVLRISRLDTLTAEQEATAKLAAAREEAAPLVTIFRPVNYAKASTISSMLKAWVGGGALTKRGNVLVDDRTNTLIISDIQPQIPVIESIITKLDKKAKQVFIEARVVRATADFSRSLSAALSGATNNPSQSTLAAGATGTGVTGTGATRGSPPSVGTASVGGFGVFVITNQSSRYILNAVLAAAETKSQAKIISRPSIVTQNNVPGTVQQGTQIPIQTTINNTISIQYVSATLSLTVTPQVTEDGNIFLSVNVQNAAPGAVLTSAGPSISTQSATTQVLVPDGGTVVFGGVTVTARTRSATYVPLIGSIPIIGHLFKTSNVQDSDQELLFFVSPKVLPG